MGFINHVITGGAPTCMGIETLIGDLRHVRSGLTESPSPKKPELTGTTEAGERLEGMTRGWIKHQFWHVYNGKYGNMSHGFNIVSMDFVQFVQFLLFLLMF